MHFVTTIIKQLHVVCYGMSGWLFLKKKKKASNPDTSLNNCSFEKYILLISPTVKMALVLTTVLHLQLIMERKKKGWAK